MSSRKTCCHHTPDQKIGMLRRHHFGKDGRVRDLRKRSAVAERVLWLATAPRRPPSCWTRSSSDPRLMST